MLQQADLGLALALALAGTLSGTTPGEGLARSPEKSSEALPQSAEMTHEPDAQSEVAAAGPDVGAGRGTALAGPAPDDLMPAYPAPTADWTLRSKMTRRAAGDEAVLAPARKKSHKHPSQVVADTAPVQEGHFGHLNISVAVHGHVLGSGTEAGGAGGTVWGYELDPACPAGQL